MGHLARLIGKQVWREIREYGEQREFAQSVFKNWRDWYVANLCGYIRTLNKMKERGLPVNPFRSVEWCNAAVLILTVADDEFQDDFMRADWEMKDRYVEAVLADGGIENLVGFFVELPPV